MKRIPSIFLLSATLLSACSTTQHTGRSSAGDDMYYSLADARKIQPVYHEDIKMQDVSPANSSDYSGSDNNSSNPNFDYNQYKQENGIDQPQQTTDQNANYNSPEYTDSYYNDQDGKTYITNNYYGDGYNDDDYYYAARIRRFHNPYAGFGYYSPAYSGFYGDPFYSSGFSIGIGYSWGWGATSIYSSWYDPFWYPYTSYYSFYNPWYNPWYSPYYNGYRHGYWNGYNDGYWAGGGSGGIYSPKNTINGPRPRRGGDVAGGGRPGGTPGSNVSPGGAADRVIDNSNGSGRVRPGTTPTGTTPANTESPSNANPSRVRPNGYTAPSLPNNNTNISDRNTNPNTPVIRDGSTRPSNSGREPAPAPVKINPNVRPGTPTTRPNNSNYSRPRQRESSTIPQQPQPQPQSTPRFESAPSRSSSGSSSPGGSSGNSGGGSAPSRSRPR